MKRKKERPYKWVTPVIKDGAGLWKLVYCPNGHLLRQVRRGAWGKAKKLKRMKCYLCAEMTGGQEE